jgi:menaquinone-dependent protoporphyrinogen IX oxidase
MLTTLLIVLAVFVGIGAFLEYSVYREENSTETLNASGAKTALLIYHPGLTSFTKDIAYAYADGLASSGWRVEAATASQQAPSDLSEYSLLVLCWPIYDLHPAPTITNYLHRAGNLQGINTTIITVGGGINPLNAQEAMKNTVSNANGSIVQSLTMFRSQRDLAAVTAEAAKLAP